MDPLTFLAGTGGIAHREAALSAGCRIPDLRRAARSGAVTVLRRQWLVTPAAPPELRAAAAAGGRLACVSVARRRGWWLPDLPPALHLHVSPHAAAGDRPPDAVAHWSVPVAPAARFSLEESVEDALRHVARCLPREEALVVWESAIRIEGLSLEAIRAVRWRAQDAQECAERVQGLSDSGLETLVVVRLSHWGVPVRQQVVLAGHRVDILIGERLVVQIDGYAHHSSAAQRGRDVAHDAELRLRGYTVIRVTYAQIVYDWPAVERMLSRAVAAGLHLA